MRFAPHLRSVGSSDLRVPREDGHARPDGRLSQVDWRDVAVLKLPESVRQLAAQGRDELLAGREWRGAMTRRHTRTTDDARAFVPMFLMRLPEFAAHRPCAATRSPAPERRQHRLPAGGGRTQPPAPRLGLRLLEGVVDRDRVSVICGVRRCARRPSRGRARRSPQLLLLAAESVGGRQPTPGLGVSRVLNRSG